MRYVDAEAFINNLKGILEDYTDNGLYPTGFSIEDAIDMIEDMPTVNVQEVKRGKWINTHHGGIHGDTIYQCSCCGNEREAYIDEENYCCNCGAKMDQEKNNEQIY